MKFSIALTTSLASSAAVIEPSDRTIGGRKIRSDDQEKFCIQMTSSPDQYLCDHPLASYTAWAGGPIAINQNGKIIGLMLPETRNFELCLDYDDVDIENDIFDLASTSDDGVCITSLSIDGTDILVGPNSKQPNFWFDGNENSCTDDFVSTQELIIQNNSVIFSKCPPKIVYG